MTKPKKATKRRKGRSASKAMLARKRLSNYTVQSGDMNWKGYAPTEDLAFRKAFDSFKEGGLSVLTRFQRIGQPYMYIATEAAIKRAGLNFKKYAS